MTRKTPLVVAAAAAMLLALSACGSSAAPEDTTDDASADGLYIALVAKVSNNPFWQAVNNGAQAAAADIGGIEVSFTGPDTESEIDKQANQLQAALDKEPDAIGIAALDEQAVLSILQAADDKGIPVVAFDAKLESDIPVTTVATDSYAAGAEAAKNFVEAAGDTGQVGVIAHSQTSSNGIARRDGFLEYLAENAPGLEVVVVQYSESDQAKASNQAAAMLQAYPDLVGIYATNEQSALGAASEVEASGKDIVVVGFDSGSAQIDYIKRGVITGSITQDPYQMGYETVVSAVAAINDETVEKFVDSGFHWYTADNIDSEEVARSLYQ